MPQLLELRWMWLPFLACLVLSINHVYLGIHVIARKVIFVDLALAQIAALGATYALILGYDAHEDPFTVALFSLSFTFVGAGAFAIARMRKEKVPQEAFIGIIYAAASAAAILLLSKSATGGEELKHMLVGDVLLVSLPEIMNMAILYGAIGVFHFVFRRRFLRISLDPEGAEDEGIRIRFWDILFYMSFGVVITKSVAIVGVLLVFSYLVVPAVIAQMWRESVRARLLLGWAVAILASTCGIVWSFYFDYPTGPAVVVMLGFFLVFSSVAYYLVHAPSPVRAATNVAAITLVTLTFAGGLAYFKKATPEGAATKLGAVELLLKELAEPDEARQLDGIKFLGPLQDARIVPALTDLLSRTKSDQVVEAIAEALSRQQDPRAIPALRHASAGDYDHFLKLTIARAQIALGDREGLATLIEILGQEDAAFARSQASETLVAVTNRDFGYDPQLPVAQNTAALKQIDDWWKADGPRLNWDKDSGKFVKR